MTDEFPDEVRRKAERMRLARAQQRSLWRHLGQIGSLGFTLALPVLLAAFLAGLIADRFERPWLGLVVLILGVVVGAVASWRQIRRSMEDG